MITPRQVFDAWRDNDLFGFDPPEEGETYRQYRARVGEEALASDRLFHFVLAELCNEDLSVEETDRRLLRAIEDMETVRAALNRSDDSDGKVETSQAVLGKGVREKTNMLYDVSVSRIQTATKDIRVEADTPRKRRRRLWSGLVMKTSGAAWWNTTSMSTERFPSMAGKRTTASSGRTKNHLPTSPPRRSVVRTWVTAPARCVPPPSRASATKPSTQAGFPPTSSARKDSARARLSALCGAVHRL